MATNTFLKCTNDIVGESTDSKHDSWTEVQGMSFSAHMPVSETQSSSGGMSTGRASMHPMSLTVAKDLAFPKFQQHLFSGQHIDEMIIEGCIIINNDQMVQDKYTLTNVIIGDINHSAQGEAGASSLHLLLYVGKYLHEYTAYDHEKGTKKGSNQAGWDQNRHTAM